MQTSGPVVKPGVRRSVVVTTMTRYSILLLSLVSTMALARLLTPAEIGVFSMAAVFVNLAHSMRDFGVGQYIIQEKELTTERVRTAFGITLAIAWAMAALLVISAPWLAEFYREPGVADVLLVLAINFALIPFGSVVLSYMNREMQFSTIFRVGITSEFLRSGSAIGLAWWGLGAMSLAWSAVVGVIATVILARVVGPAQFVLRPGFREWRRILRFGGQATLGTMAFELQRGAPDVIIGRTMTAAAVGFFGKALGVIQLFDRAVLSAVRPAVLPHMAAKHRAGAGLAGFYGHGLSLITALAWPFYAYLAAMALPVVRILYGDQWDAAVPLARILAIYGAVNVLFAFSGQALVAVGSVRLMARLRMVSLAATVLALAVAVPYGLEAVAYAMVFPALVGLLYSYRLLRATLGLGLEPYVRATVASVFLSGCTVALPIIYQWAPGGAEHRIWQTFLIGTAGAAAGWLLGVFLLRHPILDELRLLFRQARNRMRPASG